MTKTSAAGLLSARSALIKSKPLRLLLQALLITALAGAIDFWLDLEPSLGLDSLFQLRGRRLPPPQVVIVAMDEASEASLGLGQDLTTWRGHHGQLIEQLRAQGVRLIIFDLQFLQPKASIDFALAAEIKRAGNVLLSECVQKLRQGTEDFFGREECSETYKQPFVESEQQDAHLAQSLVAMRNIVPLPSIDAAALDHAPVFLAYDNGNSVVREVWLFVDALAELPNLPLLAWMHDQRRAGKLPGIADGEQALSRWLAQARRECLAGDQTRLRAASPDAVFTERLLALVCGDDTRYLDFYGPPKTLRIESYSDVYAGKVANLHNAVVFIGKANRRFSPARIDYFATPFIADGKTAGVEILATEFANLLEDRFVTMPVSPAWLDLGYGLVLVSLIIGVGGRRGAVAGLLFSVAYLALAHWCFTTRAWWLPLAVPLLLQLPLTLLLSLQLSRCRLQEEKQRISDFADRVFPQWLNALPDSPAHGSLAEAIDEQLRDVRGLCLATDIEGYTSLTSRHTPKQMWLLLNDYYQTLGRPVEQHDGIVADVTGDSMMAIWLQQDRAERHRLACWAALDMCRAVERFNRQFPRMALPTRIGLFDGDMALGPVQSAHGVHYRAIGDTVNTASRIQGVNKHLGTQILVSAAVAEEQDSLVFRPVGCFRLKGRAEPVELLEIIGLREEVDPARLQRLEQFRIALQQFRQGNWSFAVAALRLLQQQDDSDGPTQFYLSRAELNLKKPPLDWDGVISVAK